jgi:hypothetical protein
LYSLPILLRFHLPTYLNAKHLLGFFRNLLVLLAQSAFQDPFALVGMMIHLYSVLSTPTHLLAPHPSKTASARRVYISPIQHFHVNHVQKDSIAMLKGKYGHALSI